jgi:hypothetical protein
MRLVELIGGCTVEELKCRMTHREFLRWCKRLEIRQNERDPKDWQMAVVAYEVYLLRHVVTHLFAKQIPKPKLSVKQFLVEFVKTAGVEKPTKAVLAEMEARALAKSSSVTQLIKGMAAGSGENARRRQVVHGRAGKNGYGTSRR